MAKIAAPVVLVKWASWSISHSHDTTSSRIIQARSISLSTTFRPAPSQDPEIRGPALQEAIQKSWRYIASNSSELDNAARLGNASLRIWMKHMNKLKIIPPEALKW